MSIKPVDKQKILSDKETREQECDEVNSKLNGCQLLSSLDDHFYETLLLNETVKEYLDAIFDADFPLSPKLDENGNIVCNVESEKEYFNNLQKIINNSRRTGQFVDISTIAEGVNEKHRIKRGRDMTYWINNKK